ncbi:DegT/DnrJ/EryC1/StrS family aminotransferase [Terasakiella sp.]|uniref:DegT/DnrJ/EryC1/StrS family aminotransferase n=1 Tax=Terasakiella sp. TaxID=2034861 RepID=UPI003AA854C1
MTSDIALNVPIARTNLLDSEIEQVLEPLKSGWLVQGPKVREFEEKWSHFTGVKHSIAVTSCTTGLYLGLAGLGLQPGDEVIVPAFTWIATANVVEHLGAKVVFCDVDLNTFNLDVDQLDDKITSRTRAIIPVHLFGLSANMAPILALAEKHEIHVVEDAACGFGAYYKGQHVGAIGRLASFSFHPRKAITTGEGGMVTTNDDKLAQKLRCLRDHGAAMSDLQRHLGPKPYLLADHPEAGFNLRMTDIQAALGAAQMDRANDIVVERRRLACRFDKAFSSLSWLRTPQVLEGYENGYQSYPCLFQPKELNLVNVKNINEMRNAWMENLQQIGISTRPATHAVHMLEFYRNKYNLKPEDFPNAYLANDCSVSLPLFHGMTEKEQNYVIDRVLESRF